MAFKDVEITIGRQRSGGGGAPAVHEVEVRVDRAATWRSESTFSLDALGGTPKEYGLALGRQLANPRLIRALDQAGLTRGEPIRLRLAVEDDTNTLQTIRWERLWLPIGAGEWPLAAHKSVVLSRYVRDELPDEAPPNAPFLRLVLVLANPAGLADEQAIEVGRELSSFAAAFETGASERRIRVTVMPGRTGIGEAQRLRLTALGWTIRDGAATLANITDELHKGAHVAHLLAHGDFDPSSGTGTLLLEDEGGAGLVATSESLRPWLTPDLRLIVFQACLSGAAGAEGMPQFTSLAPHLIAQGLNAAVAMQDYVAMDDARVFFAEFYRTLLNEGLVDVAVSRGRQRLMQNPDSDNWSVPALFSRLRDGRLWPADPVREAVLAVLRDLPNETLYHWPHVHATEHTRGVCDFDPLRGAIGPRFDLWERSIELAKAPGAFIILTGGRGVLKSTHLRRVFRHIAEEFEAGLSEEPVPVLVSLQELAERHSTTWPVLHRLWSGSERLRGEDRERLGGRRFLILVDGDEDLAGTPRERALEAIGRLRALPGCGVMLVIDEPLLPHLRRDFESATLLVAQPLEPAQLGTYLKKLATPEAAELLDQINERGYGDIASQPRFLQHMLDLTARKKRLRSRCDVLEQVADIYLARIDTRRIPRACAEAAIHRIAWTIQNGRSADLPADELYPLLTEARGGREFSLGDLKHALVGECRLLVRSGDEGVRFAYPMMQAYFAACYLLRSPRRRRLIEDITASLGRRARLRRWEQVLVLLTGMLDDPGELLRAILAGSSLMEGEQVFLAVRCYQEALARHEGAAASGVSLGLSEEIEQMIDTLIWRSSWNATAPYEERRKALESLCDLAVSCRCVSLDRNGRGPRLITRHLVRVACDPVQSRDPDKPPYDWAGIRHVAAMCLARLHEQTTSQIEEDRPELLEPLLAWHRLEEDSAPLRALMLADDPRASVLAAFALLQSPRQADLHAVVHAYDHLSNPEVQWAIVHGLSGIEAAWVRQHVVEPWMANGKGTGSHVRAEHICYLIQKTSYGTPAIRQYLSRALLEESPRVQARALRALGKLQDADVERWLRPLCEQLVRREFAAVDRARMLVRAEQGGMRELQRSALEALRDIGDHDSIAVVRSARGRYTADDEELRNLSFQVAEEMYWRLTGGLDRESYAAGPADPHQP